MSQWLRTISGLNDKRERCLGWARRDLAVVLLFALGGMATAWAAEDPPAAPAGSAGVPSQQTSLERRSELLDAATQHAAQQQLAESLQCLRQVVELCQQIDPTGTDSDNVGVLLQTYQEMCRVLKIRGDYAEMVRVSEEALAAQRAARGKGLSDEFDSAFLMLGLGIAQFESGAPGNARSTLLTAREELRSIEGEDRSESVYLLEARICWQLASGEFRQGHLQAADQHYENAVDVSRDGCTKFEAMDCRRQLVNCLYSRARALRVADKCGLANLFAEEAFETSLQVYVVSHLQTDEATVMKCQILVGLLNRDIGELSTSRRIFESVLVKLDQAIPSMANAVEWRQNVLQNLLAIAMDQNEVADVVQYRKLLQESIEKVADAVRSPASRRHFSEIYRCLGRSFLKDGKSSEAQACFLRAFDVVDAGKSTDDEYEVRIAKILATNDLAGFCSLMGRLEDARILFDRALAMTNATLATESHGDLHTMAATVLRNAAGNCWLLGESDNSLALFERSTEIFELLTADPEYSLNIGSLVGAYTDLASVLCREGRFDEAEQELECAQASLRQGTRFYHIRGNEQEKILLTEQGRLKRARGAFVEARDLFRQALEGGAKQDGSNEPSAQLGVGQSLAELGRTYAAERDYPKALEHYQQSLVIRQALFPKTSFPAGHPSIANTLRDLGTTYLDNDQPALAFPLLQESVAMEHAFGAAFAGGTSEAQLLNLASKKFQSLGPLLEAGTRTNRPAEDVYAHIWLRHGFVARVTADRQRELRELAAGPSPELYGEYLSARQDLARALLVSFTDDHERNRDRRELLQQLNANKEQLERQLTEKFESNEDQFSASSDIQSLKSVLPDATVFVDFFACRRRPYDATVPDRADPKGERGLFAFVVSKNQPVRCVELGDAFRIGELTKAWCSSLSSDAGLALRNSVWDPVACHFPADTSTVYIAPDEDLASVAWSALPSAVDGHFLLDQYSIALVPYGKFLLEQLTKRASGRGEHTPLLVVADVNYGGTAVTLADDRNGIKDLLWTPLPWTRTEAEAIQAHMPSAAAQCLTGADATLANVLQHLPHARALHFATHGFFIDETMIAQLELLAAQGPSSSLTINRSRTSVLARSPLLRSGLVLAGANHQVRLDARGLPSLGDSVLSGEAVMALNADHVELVVLSACESGKGDSTAGDGSWGISGAFHAAGARNVVAGLWKVSDKATANLMAEFYRGLGQDGLTPLQALRTAQLKMARQASPPSSERGVDLTQTVPLSEESAKTQTAVAPLRDWAGFFLSGPGF